VLVVVVALAALGDPRADKPAGPAEANPSPSNSQPAPEPTSEAPPSQEPTTEPPPSPPPTTEAPETIEVVPEDYIGLPKDEAKRQLTDLGLRVKDEKVENPGDRNEGTVADVQPSGTLEPGDEVTLYWWGKPKPDRGEGGGPGSESPGNEGQGNNGQGNGNDGEDEE
jgi:hypothetical protein